MACLLYTSYLNDQVSTQGSYTMGQLEKALEEDKVTDAVIHQNREAVSYTHLP